MSTPLLLFASEYLLTLIQRSRSSTKKVIEETDTEGSGDEAPAKKVCLLLSRSSGNLLTVSSKLKSADNEPKLEVVDVPMKPVRWQKLRIGYAELDPARRHAIRNSDPTIHRATANYETPTNKHNKGKRMLGGRISTAVELARRAMLDVGRELSSKELNNDYPAIAEAYNRFYREVEENEPSKIGTYLGKGWNDLNSKIIRDTSYKALVKEMFP